MSVNFIRTRNLTKVEVLWVNNDPDRQITIKREAVKSTYYSEYESSFSNYVVALNSIDNSRAEFGWGSVSIYMFDDDLIPIGSINERIIQGQLQLDNYKQFMVELQTNQDSLGNPSDRLNSWMYRSKENKHPSMNTKLELYDGHDASFIPVWDIITQAIKLKRKYETLSQFVEATI